MRSVQVLVVGGGASGMMAAIMARRSGAKVMIIEKKPRLGKKLLATGNGKCNFTNRVQKESCYRSEQKELAWQIVRQFGWEQCVEWFDEIGVLGKERDGYFYPASGQATTVLRALERELMRLKVEIHTEEAVEEVLCHDRGDSSKGFLVRTDKSEYLAKRVILSTGGMAAPVHGSTGEGYQYAQHFGHQIAEPVPALTSLILDGGFMKSWSGVRIQGKVSLYNEKRDLLCEDLGEIQMVAHGISGIPVFQLSRFAARELIEKRNVFLYLDCMPEYDETRVLKEIKKRQQYNPEQSIGDVLEGMLPDKLAGVILKKAGVSISSEAKIVSEENCKQIAEVIKRMELRVKAVSDFEKAQVTAGGVLLEEIVPDTMESKLCKGLFLTGELLDVDGICGGYNLQWAWATGYLAGKACERLGQQNA